MYMRAFAEAWSEDEIVQRTVGQLPWGHNVVGCTRLRCNAGSRGWCPLCLSDARGCRATGDHAGNGEDGAGVSLLRDEPQLHRRSGQRRSSGVRRPRSQDSQSRVVGDGAVIRGPRIRARMSRFATARPGTARSGPRTPGADAIPYDVMTRGKSTSRTWTFDLQTCTHPYTAMLGKGRRANPYFPCGITASNATRQWMSGSAFDRLQETSRLLR